MTIPANNLPLFYKTPRPLDRVRDANKRLSKPTNFSFTSGTNAIPILIDEFPLSAPHYPIVFASGPSPVPAAVVGLRNDSNLYVDAKGEWISGAYMPSYIRRYPFILMDDPAQKQFVLCIDEACEWLGEEGEFPLFEGENPSSFTKGAIDFCSTLRQRGDATDEFVKALQEHNLLMNNDAQIDLPDGTRLQLSGFLVIDPQKFDALPDNIFLDWRRKGWLGVIYSHFLSSHCWTKLIELSKARS